jgi:hypothetical protein
MKRYRGRVTGRSRPPARSADTAAETGLPTGHLPVDTAREEVVLQRLAWQATPAGDAGLQFLALVTVLYWVRALAINVLALLGRTLIRMDRRGRGVL